ATSSPSHSRKDLHMDDIVIQLDALNVVDCINGISVYVVLEPLVVDCKHLLAWFRNVSVTYISRTCNIYAHFL
ncbi:hypothetical protein RYX36_000342, partial [Vicia faba]